MALVAVAALSTLGALLATALLVVPAATTRLVCSRLRPWQLATVALVAVEGVAGLWLSVQVNAPPGPAIAVLAGGVFAAVAAGRVLGRAPAGRAPRSPSARSRCSPAGAAAGGGSAAPGQVKVVATTTQIGDFARAVGGERAKVVQVLKPNTDPHDYEPRPSDVPRDGQGRRRAPQRRRASTAGWATWSRRPAATRRSSTSARASR